MNEQSLLSVSPIIKHKCFLKSKNVCMYNENASSEHTIVSRVTAVFQAAPHIAWFEDVRGAKVYMLCSQSYGSSQVPPTRLTSTTRNISDLLSVWLQINFRVCIRKLFTVVIFGFEAFKLCYVTPYVTVAHRLRSCKLDYNDTIFTLLRKITFELNSIPQFSTSQVRTGKEKHNYTLSKPQAAIFSLLAQLSFLGALHQQSNIGRLLGDAVCRLLAQASWGLKGWDLYWENAITMGTLVSERSVVGLAAWLCDRVFASLG